VTCSKEFDVIMTRRPGGRARIRDFLGRLGGRPQAQAEIKSSAAPASSTETVIYAVGDVHGRLDLLRRLEALITADLAQRQPKHARLVMLGDYIDRGADSRGVIEHLSTRKKLCSEEIFLRGNHEQVLLDFLDDAGVLGSWCHFGGLETLYAYGLKPSLPLTPESQEELRLDLRRALPPPHLSFLQGTRLSFETDTHFFAHAGVNPRVSLARQTAADLLWIRDDFLTSTRRLEKVIVHGHTPREAPEVLAHRINIDTGAYATGKLSCAVLLGARCDIIST
jgi:serine/threonine protein phosphatase 1